MIQRRRRLQGSGQAGPALDRFLEGLQGFLDGVERYLDGLDRPLEVAVAVEVGVERVLRRRLRRRLAPGWLKRRCDIFWKRDIVFKNSDW